MALDLACLRALACSALLSLLGVLAGCDRIDVTSSAELPSARCASCHLPEYLATDHPPHRGVKPTTCGTCHSQRSFHPARLEHSFPLDGAHAKTDCFACHTGAAPVFEGTPKACANCHAADHERANARISKHQSFGDDCAHCHTTSAWKPTLETHSVGEESAAAPPVQPTLERKTASEPSSKPASSPRSAPVAPEPTPVTPPRPEPTATASKRKRPDSVSGASPAWKH